MIFVLMKQEFLEDNNHQQYGKKSYKIKVTFFAYAAPFIAQNPLLQLALGPLEQR
jgi:hypothetical protein